jgi:hypothetical protein
MSYLSQLLLAPEQKPAGGCQAQAIYNAWFNFWFLNDSSKFSQNQGCSSSL